MSDRSELAKDDELRASLTLSAAIAARKAAAGLVVLAESLAAVAEAQTDTAAFVARAALSGPRRPVMRRGTDDDGRTG